MIKAKFISVNNKIQEFEICGHADYGTSGTDIVCAGVSATVITSLNLLFSLLKRDEYSYDEVEEEGYMHFTILKNLKENENFVSLVLQNLYDSLFEIAFNYPENLEVKIINRR